MRKIICGLGALLLALLFATAAPAQEVRLAVEGREHVLSGGEVWDGHLFVPLTEFARAVGMDYRWDAREGRACLFADDRAFSLDLVPGERQMMKSGIRVTWPAAPAIRQGRLYIPLRPAAEFLDYTVRDEGGRITLDFPSVPAAAQRHTDAGGRDWTVYLRSPQLTAMAGDDAYLWAGTATSGVWRISEQNPREMTPYTTFNSNLPDNRISQVWAGPDGTKWFVTDAGLVRLAGAAPEFTLVDAQFGQRGVRTAPAADGSIWMYDGRLAHLTARGEAQFTEAPPGIGALAVDPQGTVWMADDAGHIFYRTAEGTVEPFRALDQYVDPTRRGHFEDIFIDSDGSKWFVLFEDNAPADEWNPFMTQRTLLHLLADGTVETVGKEQGLAPNWWVRDLVPQPNGDKLLLMTERRSLDATMDYTFTLDGETKVLKDKREYNHFTDVGGSPYLIDRATGHFMLVESGQTPVEYRYDVNRFANPGRAFFLNRALWYAHSDALCRVSPTGDMRAYAFPANYLFGPVVKVEAAEGAHRLFVCSTFGVGSMDRMITLTGDGRFVYSNTGLNGNFYYREGVDLDEMVQEQGRMSDLLDGEWVDDVLYELGPENRYVLCRDQETYRGYLVAVDAAGTVVRSGNELPDLGPGRMLYVDPDGGLWAVFRDGVVKFSFGDGIFTSERVVESPLKGGVNYMLLDGDTLWLATASGVAKTKADLSASPW